jgi:hypothetical protein
MAAKIRKSDQLEGVDFYAARVRFFRHCASGPTAK